MTAGNPPEPVIFPPHVWVRRFFTSRPPELAVHVQGIIDSDPLLGAQFAAYLRENWRQLGVLVLAPTGAITFDTRAETLGAPGPENSTPTLAPVSFQAAPGTVQALMEILRASLGDATVPPQWDWNVTIAPHSTAAGKSVPSSIGPYAIEREIGRGGMGVVYLARQPVLNREVAVKVLPGARYNSPDAVARLVREAKIGASLRHPGVCQILDAGQSNGDFYFVMEFLPGPTLGDLIRQHGPLPIPIACAYAVEMFDVLAELARQNIVHRDVKSSNLMFGNDGRLRLLDLGLAKDLGQPDEALETRSGTTVGTPAFMSPEQIRDSRLVSPRSDLYAGGVTLFEMLTGRLPFHGKEVENFYAQILFEEAPRPRQFRPDLPQPLDDLIARMLAKDPDARPDHDYVLNQLKAFVDPSDPAPGIDMGGNLRITRSIEQHSTAATPSVVGARPPLPPTIAPATPLPTLIFEPVSSPYTSATWFTKRFLTLKKAICRVYRRLVRPTPRMDTRPPFLPVPPPQHDPTADEEVCHATLAPPIPPAELRRILVQREASQSLTSAPSVIHDRLAVACGQLRDPAGGDFVDLLPQDDGRPCVGHYRLEQRLDDTMTPVRTYQARQIETETMCIVRILPLALSTLAPDKLRQLRAARGRLVDLTQRSPYLARLVTVEKAELNRGNFTTLYYTVEDFVRGQSVEMEISNGRRLPPATARNYLCQALEGLGLLHDSPLLHGNLHPGKVFVDPERERLWICDWSHACEYRSAGVSGIDPFTQAIHGVDVIGDKSAKRRRYLAPEILYGVGRIGPAAEQYALGLLFVEALAGKFTSGGTAVDQNDYRRSIDQQNFLEEAAETDPNLARVLRRMTNLDAARRYPNLAGALAELSKLDPTRATIPPQPPPQPEPPPIELSFQSEKQSDRTTRSLADPPPAIEIPLEERERLIGVLADQARVHPDGATVYLESLLSRAGIPRRWSSTHTSTLRLSPDSAARKLIEWAELKKDDPDRPDQTILGNLLRALLPDLGFRESRYVVAVICRYHLFQSAHLLEDIQQRYLVPQPVERFAGETLNLGPEITWISQADEVVYQNWFARPSPLYDVGFLQRAMEQSAAVCRIELPGEDRWGTGFLVAPGLVLTCYHVLAPNPGDDPVAAARNARLRFGCFTTRAGSEAAGQVFVLDAHPVAAKSPVQELDYALLRIDSSVVWPRDLLCVNWDFAAPNPAVGQPLNILQHPEGGAMKIAFCQSGVSALDGRGRLQYVTPARSGSSGSPCFTDAWQVVAMHHAQRARSFGSIREGILFRRIYDEIKDQLR